MPSSVSCEEWLRRLYDHVSPNFYRAEPRMRAWTYLCSLVDAPAEGRSSRRHLATYPGERRADGAQRLLTSAQWDEDQVKKDTLGFVKNQSGAHGGKLYVTEMAFRKKGTHAAGVQRQFSAETARYENCQIGILLFYESPDGLLLLVDHDLYVPQSWIGDPARCARAGLPAGLTYRSKSAIAVNLVNRVMAAGLLPEWVLLSLLCTDKCRAQHALQQLGLPHAMTLTMGEFRSHVRASGHQVRSVAQESYAAASVEQQRDQGRAGKLRRMTLASGPTPGFDVSYLVDSGSSRGVRRAACYYYAYSSPELTSHGLGEVVANLKHLELRCWRSREDIGIDRYEVRSWRGWYRHMTLAMIAHTAHGMAKMDKEKADCLAS